MGDARRTGRSPASRAVTAALVVAVAAACWYLWPARFGGSTTFIVVGGRSMEPTYHIGDIVMVRDGEPRVGDVVAFDPPLESPDRPLVIHRIVGGDPNGWIIQGDGNGDVDPWRVPSDRIVGVRAFDVPFAGQVLPYLTTPLPWAVLLGVAVGVFLWPRTKAPGDPVGSAQADAGDAPGAGGAEPDQGEGPDEPEELVA